MHILLVQPTANSTTFGWEQGLEFLGHRVTLLTATDKRQFGGRPGADVVVLRNAQWSEALTRKSEAFHRTVGEVPGRRDIVTTLAEIAPDAAILKVDKARNIAIGRVLTRLEIPWVVWQEQLPPASRRWRVARMLGVGPVRHFTALDGRQGGVARSESETAMPRISYVPFRWDASHEVRHSTASPLRVLVVASFKNHVAKQQWSVIEAAARSGLLDGSVRFTFSGQGRESHVGYQRVQAAAREHGAENLVDLRCNVPFEGMPDLYRSHDLLILPSVREQFGMAIIEAMSFGLPVIVSDAVGAIGCVVHRKNGLVFPVSDMDALARSMRTMVDDDELRASLGRGAREFVAEHLDPERAARRIIGLLEGALV